MDAALLVGAMLTAVMFWFVLSPQLRPGVAAPESGQLDDLRGLRDQKERCVQVLRDLELDFQTKKISDADYATMKSQVSVELAQILHQLDDSNVDRR